MLKAAMGRLIKESTCDVADAWRLLDPGSGSMAYWEDIRCERDSSKPEQTRACNANGHEPDELRKTHTRESMWMWCITRGKMLCDGDRKAIEDGGHGVRC